MVGESCRTCVVGYRRCFYLSRGLACCRIEKQHKLAGGDIFGHLGGELMRADHPHAGIAIIMAVEHLRHMTTDIVVAAQRVSISDNEHP